MKRRALLAALLALVFCLTTVFPATAGQLSAKDLVLVAIDNFDLGMNQGFYQKSQSEGTLQVTRFNGSLTEETGDYSGATLRYCIQMDDSKKAVKLGYNTDIKGIAREGEIYLQDDKVIISKDFFLLLQDFGVDVFENSGVSLNDVPAYVYLADPQLAAVWEQMSSYQNGQLPVEYKELLSFVVEAIPDDCFSLSATKVTIKLDQDDLVDTVANLLAKMTNESERVAEILVGANEYGFEQMGMDAEEMKREIAAGLENMSVPTREEIQAVMSVMDVRDFTFEYSLLPGGPKTLNIDLAFKAPDGSVDGAFGVALDIAGVKDNLKGSYRIAGLLSIADDLRAELVCDGKYSYTNTVASSDLSVDVTAKDNATGELVLDLGLVNKSVTEINTKLVLDVPVLTAENSLDLATLMPTPEMSTNAAQDFDLVVNGVDLQVKARVMEQGEIMVPARAVLEQLGYQVRWVDPNEIQVINDDQTVSLFFGQKTYTVNGLEKNLSTPPCIEAGVAMIPLSFIGAELGAGIDFAEDSLVITN